MLSTVGELVEGIVCENNNLEKKKVKIYIRFRMKVTIAQVFAVTINKSDVPHINKKCITFAVY